VKKFIKIMAIGLTVTGAILIGAPTVIWVINNFPEVRPVLIILLLSYTIGAQIIYVRKRVNAND